LSSSLDQKEIDRISQLSTEDSQLHLKVKLGSRIVYTINLRMLYRAKRARALWSTLRRKEERDIRYKEKYTKEEKVSLYGQKA